MLYNLLNYFLFRHIYKILSVFNLVIGTTAFAFQLKCLYPWHLQLDDSFSKLCYQRDKENIEKIDKLNNIENILSIMEENIITVRSRISNKL